MRTVAVIPAYNEEGTIGSVIRDAKGYVDSVIVVDDGSSDNTLKEAEKAGPDTINLGEVKINTDWRQYEKEFTVTQTLIDKLSTIPFKNTLAAKIIFTSPLRPWIYTIVNRLKISEERMEWDGKEIVNV